jgi:NAD+ diphosphatase
MTRPLPVWHLEPASSSSRLLVFQGNDLVYPGEAMADPLFSHAQATALGEFEAAPLLVARWRGDDIYAVALAAPATQSSPARTLRAVLTEDSPDFAALASTAVQLLHWQRDNRFCGRCGEPTRLHESERAHYCDQCDYRLFPRLSPCVIVAIQRRGKVLLAQSHRAAGRFFSLIAGFVEPGESAEEAVHREVAEETGLTVTNLRYVESQSWAFPHQLMLGYLVDYESGDLVLEEAELADADWFDADSLPAVPGEWTIAGKLIRYALEASA